MERTKRPKEDMASSLPEYVQYPRLQWVTPNVYYKKIRHPARPKVLIYVSSFDLFPLISLVTTSNHDTPEQIQEKMRDFIMVLNRIDNYNNLPPAVYTWNKTAGGIIEITVATTKSKPKGDTHD